MAYLTFTLASLRRYWQRGLVMLFGLFLAVAVVSYGDIAFAASIQSGNIEANSTHNTSKGGESAAPEWYPNDHRDLKQMARDTDVKEGVDRLKSANRNSGSAVRDQIDDKLNDAKNALQDKLQDAQDAVQGNRSIN